MFVNLLTDNSTQSESWAKHKQSNHSSLPHKTLFWSRTVQSRQTPFAHWRGHLAHVQSKRSVSCSVANYHLATNESFATSANKHQWELWIYRQNDAVQLRPVTQDTTSWMTYTAHLVTYVSGYPYQTSWCTGNKLHELKSYNRGATVYDSFSLVSVQTGILQYTGQVFNNLRFP